MEKSDFLVIILILLYNSPLLIFRGNCEVREQFDVRLNITWKWWVLLTLSNKESTSQYSDLFYHTGLFMTGCNFAIQPCRLCFTEDSSPSVAPEHRSLSHPRLAPGSPDSRLCRKLSPVEIYYEMRTRRNSASSSVRWAEGEDGMCPPAETGLHYNLHYNYNLWMCECSFSPSHSLPRSASNVEGRSVPATPLLSRTAPISVHVR